MLNALLTSVIWAEVSLFVLILFNEQHTVELRSLPFIVQLIISSSPESLTDFSLPVYLSEQQIFISYSICSSIIFICLMKCCKIIHLALLTWSW